MTKRTVAPILLILFFCIPMRGDKDFPPLRGPYLGQKPPGTTPALFAPGIISTDESEGSSGFALEGSVFIFQEFTDRKSRTFIMRLKGETWSAPELIPFWETMVHNGDFVFSSDDKTMLYQVKTETENGLVSNIWKVEVTKNGWGERSPLPPPVNTRYDESFASEATNKNLYFFSRRPEGKGQSDLYMCTWENGVYSEPVNLAALNTAHHEWDPFIAPDESWLIFCSTKPDGLGEDDLYISFKGKNGKWMPPEHMGREINSPGSENRPFVSRDGRYFFYTSTRNGNRDTFWVGAEILDRFRKEQPH
ncbi:MAG: hypothetical protein MUP70_07775 [Candidatus Aminicenantes bacterium]|nr:hypothetical protein [Candidatus Aminicenantes bacterium]